MESLLNMPMGETFLLLEWWQWIAVVVLIVLIIVYVQLRKRQV